MLLREQMSATGVLAHPVSGHPHVDIPLALTAAGGALLVFVVALATPARPSPATTSADLDASWAGALSRGQLTMRCASVALLCLAIAAGRVGQDDELENLAPALVVGVAWPLTVLGSVTVGPVWRWLDPWDTIARTFSRHDQSADPATNVWAAVPVVAVVLWFLSVHPDPLDPRAVGSALALYTIFTVAGCIAFGRVPWLASREPLGVMLGWMSAIPRRRLTDWDPPRGAEALLGVVAGGVLFGAVRRSGVWISISRDPESLVTATLGLAVTSALAAVLLTVTARLARRVGGRAGVARAVVPAVAGIIVAVALERNRLLISLQLLPGLLGDPFGLGWDLLGAPVEGMDPAPLGAAGLLGLQLAVLLVAHLLGAVIASRRLEDTARLPASLALLHLMAGSVAAVAVH